MPTRAEILTEVFAGKKIQNPQEGGIRQIEVIGLLRQDPTPYSELWSECVKSRDPELTAEVIKAMLGLNASDPYECFDWLEKILKAALRLTKDGWAMPNQNEHLGLQLEADLAFGVFELILGLPLGLFEASEYFCRSDSTTRSCFEDKLVDLNVILINSLTKKADEVLYDIFGVRLASFRERTGTAIKDYFRNRTNVRPPTSAIKIMERTVVSKTRF